LIKKFKHNPINNTQLLKKLINKMTTKIVNRQVVHQVQMINKHQQMDKLNKENKDKLKKLEAFKNMMA